MGESNQQTDPKSRIRAAAVTLFARKGYAGTGMRELAKAAGVNLGMINYYFGSKIRVLEDIIDTFFSRYIDVLEAELSRNQPPEEVLKHTIPKVVELFRSNPDEAIVALTEFPYDHPEIAEYKFGYIQRILTAARQNLLPQVEEHSGRALRPEIIGPALMGMVASHFIFRPVLQSMRTEPFDEAFYTEYTETITRLLLYGLFGRPIGAESAKGEGTRDV